MKQINKLIDNSWHKIRNDIYNDASFDVWYKFFAEADTKIWNEVGNQLFNEINTNIENAIQNQLNEAN